MKNLSFSLIQSEIIWEAPEDNRMFFESKISELSSGQIVLLPETFTTGFSAKAVEQAEDMQGPSIAWMKKVSKERNLILGGSLIIEEDGKIYNRFIWMQPDGKFHFYNKRHLFSYGGEGDKFTAGDKRTIVSANGWKINLQVCYDLRFPVWSRMRTENEFDILIYVANWPEQRIEAWNSLLKARAIENQSFVIGLNRIGSDGNELNYIGESQLIHPSGDLICKEKNNEAVISFTLEKAEIISHRKKYPFLRDRDKFNVI